MAIPTWNTGQVLSSSDVNLWFVPIAAYKNSGTGRQSTTSMTADPDLVLPVAASAVYNIESILFYQGGATGSSDFKWAYTGPSGAVFTYGAVYLSGSTLTLSQQQQIGTGSPLVAGTNTLSNQLQARVTGTLVTSATAGNFSLVWAQGTSSATITTLLTNSNMVAQRIS